MSNERFLGEMGGGIAPPRCDWQCIAVVEAGLQVTLLSSQSGSNPEIEPRNTEVKKRKVLGAETLYLLGGKPGKVPFKAKLTPNQ